MVAGCFLPWMQEGDLFSYWTPGIRIYPSIQDNGGLTILLITIIVAILNFRPPQFIARPLLWNILISFLLLPLLANFFYWFLWYQDYYGNAIGAPVLNIGFYMVLLGSVLIIVSSLLRYIKK